MTGNRLHKLFKFYLPLWLAAVVIISGSLAYTARIAQAAIAVGTSNIKTNTGAVTSTQVTITINAGMTVVVVTALTGTAGTVSAVTDSAGDTFVAGPRSATRQAVEIWYFLSATASTNITVTHSSSRSVVAVETFTGVNSIGINNTNTGTTAPTVTLNTQDANNYVVAGFSGDSSTAFSTGAAGTIRQAGGFGGGSAHDGALGDNTSASASATAVTPTSFAVNYDAALLELRSTGAAPASTPVRHQVIIISKAKQNYQV